MTLSISPAIEHFRALYRLNADPWQVQTRWYEQRKRALILACLPKQHYENAYEPGCGNGELTVSLALRSSRLLATDGADSAIALTRKKVEEKNLQSCVQVMQQYIPEQWPDSSLGRFDLIVVSELAYYLKPDALTIFIDHISKSLAGGATLLLSHWRHPFNDRVNNTKDIHAQFHKLTSLTPLTHHDDRDFILDVWSYTMPLAKVLEK